MDTLSKWEKDWLLDLMLERPECDEPSYLDKKTLRSIKQKIQRYMKVIKQ